ncbi:hypothetical protein DCBHLPFO_00766 [Mycoplasmopsis arginini]|uniref:Uncharacterized protein n=1 Tax=Mycoplasmopsis arginini TaxID=2094 RepID=A0AA43U056_MYCAR|nr:hypothetical protein [Mycoplasmopsis arginini]
MCCTQQDPISCPNPISCTLLVIDSIALVNNMSGAALAKLSLLLSVFISSKSLVQLVLTINSIKKVAAPKYILFRFMIIYIYIIKICN